MYNKTKRCIFMKQILQFSFYKIRTLVKSFDHEFVAMFRKYRMHEKDILSFSGFVYRHASLVVLYLVVLRIIITKIR